MRQQLCVYTAAEEQGLVWEVVTVTPFLPVLVLPAPLEAIRQSVMGLQFIIIQSLDARICLHLRTWDGRKHHLQEAH